MNFNPNRPSPYVSSSRQSNWRGKATADRRHKRDGNATVAVPLVVPPPGEHAQAGAVGESSEPGTVELRLWLPGLEWVEGETIEGRLLFEPGQQVDLPFRLPIRVMGCPARRTASSTVVYTLEATLSRRLRKNYTVSAETWLYNGRRM